MSGLSIVIEGIPEKQVAEISSALIKKLEAKGKKCLDDTAFRNRDENILAANQRLLDVSSAQLEPSTLSLLVVIKLQQRLKKIQKAKNQGNYCLSNVSWLSDAAYYESRGNAAIAEQLIVDCGLIRPDAWIIIDEPGGVYAKLAKRAGVRVYSPKLPRTQLINTILEHITYAEKKQSQPPKKPSVVETPAPESPKPEVKQAYTVHVSHLALPTILEAVSGPKAIKPLLYEKKDKKGKYPYHRPSNVEPKVLKAYDTILTKIFDNYTQVVSALATYLQGTGTPKDATIQAARTVARGMLPLCSLSMVTTDEPLPHIVSNLQEVQLLSPKTKNKQPAISYELEKLAADIVPQNFENNTTPGVHLASYTPRNELDLITSILYTTAESSMQTLRDAAVDLPGETKQRIFETYLRDGHDRRALRDVTYVWDVLSEFDAFEGATLSLPRHSVQHQAFTPRYGYDVPAVIEDAGVSDLYEQAFDLSLELYNLLQAAGYQREAQYAVLAGHRAYWKISINGEELRAFMKNNALSHLSAFKEQLRLHVAEVHPLVAQFL